MAKVWKDVEGDLPKTPRPKPVFDLDRIVYFLSSYFAAADEADRTQKVVAFGKYRVSPSKLWRSAGEAA